MFLRLLFSIVVFVLVFYLYPSSVRVVATFSGTVLFPLLCSVLPFFPLIHWFFSLSNFVIPSKCLKNFICAASKRCSSLWQICMYVTQNLSKIEISCITGQLGYKHTFFFTKCCVRNYIDFVYIFEKLKHAVCWSVKMLPVCCTTVYQWVTTDCCFVSWKLTNMCSDVNNMRWVQRCADSSCQPPIL